MMKKLNLYTVAAMVALGGCSHYGEDLSALDAEMTKPVLVATSAPAQNPQDITPAAGGGAGMMPESTSAQSQYAAPTAITATATAAPSALPQYLAREYYAMAKYENDTAYDYRAAKSYTQKAMMAAKGKAVAPSKLESFDLNAQRAAELNTARAQLTTALAEQNTLENAQSLAKAQARYECWIERAEEAVNDAHYESCKSEFEAAMATLTMPAAGEAQADMVGNNQQVLAPAAHPAKPATTPVWKEEPAALDFLGQGAPPKTN